MNSVRRRALEALNDISYNGAYANLRLKTAAAGLDERDAAWLFAAVYTAIENLQRIDAAIDAHAKGKIDKSIRGILRLGAAQALFMNTPASAACNESVKLAKEIGKGMLSGYVNAVMRAICREGAPALPEDAAGALGAEFGYPKWLVEEYIVRFGAEFTRKLLSARPGGLSVRAQYPFTAAELEGELIGRGVPFTRGRLDGEAFHIPGGADITADPLFSSGKISVQSESAMLACRAVSPAPGMRILDACAAPGGKTAYISSLMRGEGMIEAWELHPHRAELISKTLERLHVENAKVSVRDASLFHAECEGAFDAVLVDAPCSGFGIPGKPDIRLNRTEDSIAGLAELQAKLIEACCRYVKIGGALVYSTCTVSGRENEGIVRAFLAKHSEFAPDKMDFLPKELSGRVENGGIQLFQSVDGIEGFYIARIKRCEA